MFNKVLVDTARCDFCDKKGDQVFIHQFFFNLNIRTVCRPCGRARFD